MRRNHLRLLHSIPDAMELLGISRSTVYKKIGSGELAVVRIGRRTFIEDDELTRFVASLRAAPQTGPVKATDTRITPAAGQGAAR